ncbi:MAG TPA: hypothetical protein VHA73_10410 [Acidimicrobiales bacterium]|nr:hypothetical protein [Acidimicrobiales bacterium]
MARTARATGSAASRASSPAAESGGWSGGDLFVAVLRLLGPAPPSSSHC